MIELAGDLFDPPLPVWGICIPTNGDVRRGLAVMGAGVALAARRRFPGIDSILGAHIQRKGNQLFPLTEAPDEIPRLGGVVVPYRIFAFPTKDHWREPSTLGRIRRSAEELFLLTPPDAVVALPRVGCGLGGLSWTDVKHILERALPGGSYVVLHPK